MSHMKCRAIVAALLTFAAGTSCRAMTNYPSPVAPRYAAALPGQPLAFDTHASLPPPRRSASRQPWGWDTSTIPRACTPARTETSATQSYRVGRSPRIKS